MLFRVVSVLIVLFASVAARADIYRVMAKGNTIGPLRSTEIAMDSETVVVDAERRFGGFKVVADFSMRNTTGETVTHDVAFPFDDERAARIAKEGFRVVLGRDPNAVPVKVIEIKVRDPAIKEPRSSYDYPAALVWRVTWAPGETKLISLAFDMGDPDQFSGLVRGWRLRYVVRTGGLWHGPIGHAEITMRLDGHRMYADDFAAAQKTQTPPVLSYPKNAKLISPTEVKWTFKDWLPGEDIAIDRLAWPTVTREERDRFFLATPQPYLGAKSDYTDAWLDSVVVTLVEPWRERFPRESQRDWPVIKSLVAEWLYQEVFARNGEPFIIEYDRKGPRPPGIAFWDQNDVAYSVWHNRFPSINGYRNPGWYKPGTGKGPKGSVRMEDLTDQERRNLAFLQQYFSPKNTTP